MQQIANSVLDDRALDFIARLQHRFGARRMELLDRRVRVQERIDQGESPGFFLQGSHPAHDPAWRIAPVPDGLLPRKVEITGPPERKMMINALNSGADVYMVDFEDSHAPTWEATLRGQWNLQEAVRRTIVHHTPEKSYRLNDTTAILMVRPRGWHLEEKHVTVDGKPVSASLFDFGLAFYHNARELIRQGSGPYFYLPKLESHLEARLWNDVFVFAQDQLEIPQGTIKATVLIETVLAAFEMDEILYELREHSAGLNCGRWDYIFSFIKKFRNRPSYVLPDRRLVTMGRSFLKAYSELLIQTCHRRGAHAMGGMAAYIPVKSDPGANQMALDKVSEDKWREVRAGHDGTWVAHPGLVPLARKIFDSGISGKNQLERMREEVRLRSEDLLQVPEGDITETGLRTNVRVGLIYLESWLRGTGCVPIDHLMEDAATAEISRAQLWQWLRHGRIAEADYRKALKEESERIEREGIDPESLARASSLFQSLVESEEFPEFLTIPAYDLLTQREVTRRIA